MKKLNLSIFTAITLTLTFFSAQVSAADWHLLGSRVVNDRTESDVINVGADEGRFRKLRLDVGKAAIELNRVVVTFGNGEQQIVEQDRIISKRGRGPVLNLDGGQRFIKRVKLVYEAKTRGFKKATVRLYGG